MKNKKVLFVLLILTFVVVGFFIHNKITKSTQFVVYRVAHAGGEINGKT